MDYIKSYTIKLLLFTKVFIALNILLAPNAAASVHSQGATNETGVSQQGIVVTGVVFDESGEPMPGVTVVVRGTTNGTITDIDGNYSINIPNGDAVLGFSFIGYKTSEVAARGQSTINVTLIESTQEMDEVVVVGYGTQRRGSVTGAIAQYNAEKLTERPVQRVDQALVGQMAGVHVKQTSGMPGSGLKVQVRGTGSISANSEPLYVIDGFPLDVASQDASGKYVSGNPLDNINPNDIESIQVLKDASAAAIYGSRAANGVVLITTKKGQTGKAKINLNYYTGWNEPVRHIKMLNGEQWIERATESLNYTYLRGDDGTQNRSIHDDYDTRVAKIGSFNRNMIPDPRWSQPGYPGLAIVDWQDEIFRKGWTSNYQLSASGANDAVKYFVSADYLSQEGFTIGVDYERYSARANVEVAANKRLTIGLNVSPSYAVGNDPGVEGKDNQFHLAISTPPVVEAGNGLYFNTGDIPSYTWGNNRNSPLGVLENTIGETKTFRTLATLFGELEIIDKLRARTTLNLDNVDQRYKYYRPASVSGTPVARSASGQFIGYNKQTFVNENTLSYDKTFAEKHNISAVGGFSFNVNNLNNFQIYSSGGFGTDYIQTLNDASGINASRTYTLESRNVLVSYFGRVNYNFLHRYMATASIRRDGSSRFGNNTKWGVFPAASAGWLISEESFLEDARWLSNLKLRASWGLSGNNGLGGDYEHIALLQSAYYSFGGNQAVGMASKNIANRDLSWEESETFNYGIDFGILKNRISGSVEYYTKTNTNLLLEINVPTVTGFETALTNIGEVWNQGLEIELNSHNFTGPFSWSTSFNISFNKNEVKHLGPNDAPILGTTSFDISHNILQVGQPMYSIFVVKQDGILTQADIDNNVPLYGTQVAGDPKYVDADKDGVITPNDRVIVGHPNPDYIWGMTNNFKYKDFDLSIFVQGQQGGKIYSMFGRAIDRTGTSWEDNTIVAWDDRWRSADSPGAGSKGKVNSTFGRIKNTDWLYSSDYWRIRNITLGYNLGRLMPSNFVQGARVYVTAENWFGKDKYTGGANPEALNTEGDDYGGIPLAKSIIFGVNFTF